MGNTRMSEVTVAQIAEEWSWVKTGVQEVHDLMPWVDWTVQDVFDRCHAGDAILFVSDKGFTVFIVVTNPLTLERTFFGWIAWAKNGKGEKLVARYFDYFCDVGRQLSCTRIGVETPVQPIGDMLVEFGWRLDMSKYSFSLEETTHEI